jgi:hypothetical protein
MISPKEWQWKGILLPGCSFSDRGRRRMDSRAAAADSCCSSISGLAADGLVGEVHVQFLFRDFSSLIFIHSRLDSRLVVLRLGGRR